MKKIFGLFIILMIVVLTFSSCAEKSTNDDATTQVADTTIASTPTETTTETTTEQTTKDDSVIYSTNDYETAKEGKSGVFSYVSKDGSYDVYWIIDFDEGYAYTFTEGNDNETCDKVKITSGDLNDRVTITWDFDGETTDWYMFFKYKKNPATLIVNDHMGISTEFTTTDLDHALELKSKKQ